MIVVMNGSSNSWVLCVRHGEQRADLRYLGALSGDRFLYGTQLLQ